MRSMHLIILAMAAALSAVPAFAATLRVPSEYPTIRAAVEAASSGDEILLAPGRYTGDGSKRIQIDGVSLTLRSEAGPEATIIDGEDSGWGFRFVLEEGDALRISGIEFTRLRGLAGSALRVRGDGDVVIEDCRFVACTDWNFDPEGEGGGVVLVSNHVQASIRRCRFLENPETTSSTGALRLETTGPTIVEDCEFMLNALRAVSVASSSTSVTITSTEFVHNTATIGALGGDVEIVDCSFVNNGAGIFSYADLTVRGSTFARTGAIRAYRGSLYAENSILSDGCPGSGIEARAPVTLVCCALDSTRVEGWEHITLVGEQVWEDPLFCDPEPCQPSYFNDGAIDRYRLHSDSPCVWWRSPCGVRIGSLDVGCGAAGIGACCLEEGCFLAPQEECEAAGGMFEGAGTTCEPSPCGVTPTVPMSWGTIKQLFR